VELVGLRFGVRKRLDALPEVRERAADLQRPPTAEVVTSGATVQARLADAAKLAVGEIVSGPALIEGYSSTTWVPPGWSGARDISGNMLLRKEG
jgi:N-methylhydantoinase A